jgi:hypothetical protein
MSIAVPPVGPKERVHMVIGDVEPAKAIVRIRIGITAPLYHALDTGLQGGQSRTQSVE